MLYKRIITLITVVLFTTVVYSQGPDDPTEEDPDAIPIGKAEILLTAGIIYGVRRIVILN